MPPAFHPQTTASRPPACACGLPLADLLPGSSPLLFRAACCFATYQLVNLEVAAGSVPVLAFIKDGPEEIGPGICDGCEAPSSHLWDVSAPPEFIGIALCRDCMENGVGGIPPKPPP